MKKLIKRLSMVLVAVFMFVSVLPMTAFADEVVDNPLTTYDESQSVMLTIHKYAGEGTELAHDGTQLDDNLLQGLTPLANIEFKITLTTIPVGNPENVTLQDVKNDTTNKYIPAEPITVTKATDKDGMAKFEGLAQGVYYVEELEKPGVTMEGNGMPFLVSLPMTLPDGDDWNYDVHVYPKNQIKDTTSIEKHIVVKDDDEEVLIDHKGVMVGEIVDYRIQSALPVDIDDPTFGTGNKDGQNYQYTVTDTLDEDLEFVAGSMKVYGVKENGEKVALNGNTDYTVTDHFVVTLKAKTGNADGRQTALEECTHLCIDFQAKVLNGAAERSHVVNKASVKYTNSYGQNNDADSEKTEVHTGNIYIEKYQEDGKTLIDGAEFKLVDEAGNDILGADGQAVKVENQKDEDGNIIVGKFVVKGLAYGKNDTDYTSAQTKYYLIETKAPAGYKLLVNPIEVVLLYDGIKDTKVADILVKVTNTKDFDLPITGGSGTLMFTVVGLMMVGAAAAVYFKARRVQD